MFSIVYHGPVIKLAFFYNHDDWEETPSMFCELRVQVWRVAMSLSRKHCVVILFCAGDQAVQGCNKVIYIFLCHAACSWILPIGISFVTSPLLCTMTWWTQSMLVDMLFLPAHRPLLCLGLSPTFNGKNKCWPSVPDWLVFLREICQNFQLMFLTNWSLHLYIFIERHMF